MPEGHRDEANGSRSERVYRTLLRAYPKDLRREYGEEMARTFRDLRHRELERRGVRGIVLLWARTLPELAFTASKERNTMLARNFARNAYLPARPVVVTRWGGLSAILGGVMGTVAYYIGVSFSLPISFVLLLFSVLLSTLGLFGLYGSLATTSGRLGHPGRIASTGALLATASLVSWLAQGSFVALSIAWGWATFPVHVATVTAVCCWFVGLLLLGIAALRMRLPGRLRVLPLTVVALVPVSVVLPLVTTVGMPLVTSLPFLGTALLGWFLLKSTVNDGLAMSGIGVSISRAASVTARGVGGMRSPRPVTSVTEAAREKELLEALRRHGELTVTGAALETSLSVEEAERMLSALAAKGYLEVRVAQGRLLYSLWEGDGPAV